jgi:nicotinamidase/pyrazinamidase
MDHDSVGAPIDPQAGDALIVVDAQNDFLPDGELPVPGVDAVIRIRNRYLSPVACRDVAAHDRRLGRP